MSAGLSVSNLARWQDVTVRTAQRWADGSYAVPADIQEAVGGLIAAQAQAANATLGRIAMHENARVAVVVYRDDDDARDWTDWPCAGAHAAVLRRLLESGAELALIPFDPDAYSAWLHGREDTRAVRAEWAATAGDHRRLKLVSEDGSA